MAVTYPLDRDELRLIDCTDDFPTVTAEDHCADEKALSPVVIEVLFDRRWLASVYPP